MNIQNIKTAFKPFDKVLVRDGNAFVWQPELFYKINKEGKYCTLGDVEWQQCILYEGNEHLLDTTNTPENIDLDNNILFGIELKAGYVLEFAHESENECGIIFPTEYGLAISFTKGHWCSLKNLNKLEIEDIVGIYNYAKDKYITSGEVLWEKYDKSKTI